MTNILNSLRDLWPLPLISAKGRAVAGASPCSAHPRMMLPQEENQPWINGADNCLWCLLLFNRPGTHLHHNYDQRTNLIFFLLSHLQLQFHSSCHIWKSWHILFVSKWQCASVYSFLYFKGKKCDFWADFCDKPGAYEYLFWMLQFIQVLFL